MIRFACPTCEKVYSVPNTAGGKAATCKQCGGRFQIPDAPPPEPEELQPDAEPEPQADYEEVVDDPLTPPVVYEEFVEEPPSAPLPEPVSHAHATHLAFTEIEPPGIPPPPMVEELSFAPPPAPEPPPTLPEPDLVPLRPCPSCGTQMTVPRDDVGGQVECSGCKSSFFAMDATPPKELPPPPPPVTVDIAPCPKCGAELTVEVGDLGKEIECPHCRGNYLAKRPATIAPVRATVATRPAGPTVVTPAKRRDDDDDVPAARPASGGKEKPYEFKKKKSGPYRDDEDNAEYEDDEKKRKRREEKPRKKKKLTQYDERHRTFLPHDGILLLLVALVALPVAGVGLFSCVVFYFLAPLLCLYVVFKGLYSLSEIRKGIMDPAGNGLILSAVVIAGLGILSSVGLMVWHYGWVAPAAAKAVNGG